MHMIITTSGVSDCHGMHKCDECRRPKREMIIIMRVQNISLSPGYLETARAFGFLNICINPLIYAARYEVFKLSLKKMLKIDSTVTTAAAPGK